MTVDTHHGIIGKGTDMLANITNLSSLIDEYAETKGFIERALEQNTTFSEDVIKKVVAELQEKISDITKQIEPLISDAQFFLSETQNEIKSRIITVISSKLQFRIFARFFHL